MATWGKQLLLLGVLSLFVSEQGFAFGRRGGGGGIFRGGGRRGGGRTWNNPAAGNVAQGVQNYQKDAVQPAQQKAKESQAQAQQAQQKADAAAKTAGSKGANDPGKGAADKAAAAAKQQAELAKQQAEKDKKDAEDKKKTLEKMNETVEGLAERDPGAGDLSDQLEPSEDSGLSAEDRMPAAETNPQAPESISDQNIPSDGGAEIPESGASRAESAPPSDPDIQTTKQLEQQMADMAEMKWGGDTKATDVAEGPTAPSEPSEAKPASMENSRQSGPSEGSSSKPEPNRADEISKPSDPSTETPEMTRTEPKQAEPSTETSKVPGRDEAQAAKAEKNPDAPKPSETKPSEVVKKVADGLKDIRDSLAKEPIDWEKTFKQIENSRNMKQLMKDWGKVQDGASKAFEKALNSETPIKSSVEALGESAKKLYEFGRDAPYHQLEVFVDDFVAGEKGIYDDAAASVGNELSGKANSLPQSEAIDMAKNLLGPRVLKEMTPAQMQPYTDKYGKYGEGAQHRDQAIIDDKNFAPDAALKEYIKDSRATLGDSASPQQVQQDAEGRLLNDLTAAYEKQGSPTPAERAKYVLNEGMKSYTEGQKPVQTRIDIDGKTYVNAPDIWNKIIQDVATQKMYGVKGEYDMGYARNPLPRVKPSSSTSTPSVASKSSTGNSVSRTTSGTTTSRAPASSSSSGTRSAPASAPRTTSSAPATRSVPTSGTRTTSSTPAPRSSPTSASVARTSSTAPANRQTPALFNSRGRIVPASVQYNVLRR